MRKTLLTLLAVMLSSFSAAWAADIVEDWTTKDRFGPTNNSGVSAIKGTSEATQIEYSFARAAKIVSTSTSTNSYLTLAARSGSYIEFALPINCSQIKVLAKSTVAANAAITFTANGNSVEASKTVDQGGEEYTLEIPAEYQAVGTVYRIARKLGTPVFDKFTYVEAVEEGPKALTVPYSLAFDEPETLADWTILCPQIGDATPRQIFQYFTAGAAPFYSCPNAGVGSRYITSASAYEYKNSWLISPAIKLEAGKKYYVKYNVAATNGQNTNLGIYYGTEPTAEALTNQALEQKGYFGKGFFPESNFFSIEGTMTPSANGVYYVGLYNNDDKYNSANLIVFDISIIEAASGDMPGAPTDFTATAAADGDLYVVLSAKAPTTDAAGNDLAELTALEFLRGDKVINTVNNPEKGKVYTYTDKEAVNGLNKYAVRAVNSKGNSDLVETSAKAGLQIPKELESITAEQTSTGMVKFTWKKPLYDFYGTMFVNPDLVTVKIEAYDGATLIKTFELEGDDATVELLPETTVDQKFFNFKAYAVTNGGPSLNGIDLNGIAVGKPAELPYSENFAGNEAHNPMYNSTNEGQYGYRASWDFVNSIEDVPVACLNGQAYGSQASLISGLIEIPAGSENQMTFKYSNNGSMSAANILTVKINGEEVWSKTVSNSEFDTAEIDLTPYAGKTIQFSLTGKQTNALHYRNIIVTDILIDKKSGIADIEADENAPVEYFNLQGIRVENPAAGIYIRRQGSKVTKVLVK